MSYKFSFKCVVIFIKKIFFFSLITKLKIVRHKNKLITIKKTTGDTCKCTFCNGNRTSWRPIRSVFIQVITKSDSRDFVITSMITDRIGRHEVLLPINHKNYNFQEKKNSQVMKEREHCT